MSNPRPCQGEPLRTGWDPYNQTTERERHTRSPKLTPACFPNIRLEMTIELTLDDDLERLLNRISSRTHQDQREVLQRVVHDYLRAEALRERLADPALVSLYQELQAEDVQLSEAGFADYAHSLDAEDRA